MKKEKIKKQGLSKPSAKKLKAKFSINKIHRINIMKTSLKASKSESFVIRREKKSFGPTSALTMSDLAQVTPRLDHVSQSAMPLGTTACRKNLRKFIGRRYLATASGPL